MPFTQQLIVFSRKSADRAQAGAGYFNSQLQVTGRMEIMGFSRVRLGQAASAAVAMSHLLFAAVAEAAPIGLTHYLILDL